MNSIGASRTMSRPFGIGLVIACLWLGLAVIPAAAEGEASKKGSAATAEKSSNLRMWKFIKSFLEPVRLL